MRKVLVDRELLRDCSAELSDWRMSFPDAHAGMTDRLIGEIDAILAQPAEAEGVDEFGLFCANCGKPLTRDGTLVTGPGIDHEEVCCSQWCHDEHERLRCPQGEPGGSFRDAEWYGRKLSAVTAERDRLLEHTAKAQEHALDMGNKALAANQLVMEVRGVVYQSYIDRCDPEAAGECLAKIDAVIAAMAAKEA